MLKSFFWMCSGADPDQLSACSKAEQIKFAGIGGTVFFTAVMAFIASSYALYTVFDSYFSAVFFGLIWGLLIFNLDRFIISSLKKRERKSDEFIHAMPRIILAIIIAVVISKPLEIKIFEKEIDQVLLIKKNEMLLANQDQIGMLFQKEKTEIAGQIDELNTTITSKENEVNNLYATYIAEAEGREGTKLLGKGPVYQEKRNKHDQLLAELQVLKTNAAEEKMALQTQLEEVKLKEQTQVESTAPIVNGFDGLMARINALNDLPFLPSFFIFLLFLAIETSPIFAKLLSPKGSYDLQVANSEHKVFIWAEQKKRQREMLLATETLLNKKVYDSLAKEDESYHYKKQKARTLIHLQADAFLDEQKNIVTG